MRRSCTIESDAPKPKQEHPESKALPDAKSPMLDDAEAVLLSDEDEDDRFDDVIAAAPTRTSGTLATS